MLTQNLDQTSDQGEHSELILKRRSEHNNPSILIWRIRLDVSEICVERDQYASFGPQHHTDHIVASAGQSFFSDSVGLESCSPQQIRCLVRQIFVNLEFHVPDWSGSGAVLSLASSAA